MLPLFCKTKELLAYKNTNFQSEYYGKESIGNFNWEIMMEQHWRLKETSDDYLSPIFCLLSGNPSITYSTHSNNEQSTDSKYLIDNNHDRLLYFLNCFYNTKVYDECNKLNYEMVEFTPSDLQNSCQLNRESFLNSLQDILEYFKRHDPEKSKPNNIFFLVELNLITIHLIKSRRRMDKKNPIYGNTFKDTTNEDFLKYFNQLLSFLNKIIEDCRKSSISNSAIINSSKVDSRIKIHDNLYYNLFTFGKQQQKKLLQSNSSNKNIKTEVNQNLNINNINSINSELNGKCFTINPDNSDFALTNEYCCNKYFFTLIVIAYNFYSTTFNQILKDLDNAPFDQTSLNNTLQPIVSEQITNPNKGVINKLYEEMKMLFDSILIEFFTVLHKVNEDLTQKIILNTDNRNYVTYPGVLNDDNLRNIYNLSKIHNSVIILGFCLNIRQIKNGVIKLCEKISPNDYHKLSDELNKYMGLLSNELRLEIIGNDFNQANNQSTSNSRGGINEIQKIEFEKSLVRDENDLYDEDRNLINKYYKIFDAKISEENTKMLNLLAKICFYFINNNKFIEAEKVVGNYGEIIEILSSKIQVNGKLFS